MKSNSKDLQCWRNSRLQICPFETPIPVGTRSKKQKNKKNVTSNFTKIARYWKNTKHLIINSYKYKFYLRAYPKAVNVI
ncbi:hypothetical protein HYD56_01415 [Mycoplasmopsis bovis]|nr:hypothetical protein HYD56_01415 [Mycoplasmopsis bovis]